MMSDLGATGRFPHPKLNDDDEGELRLVVGYDRISGLVRVEFGKPVAWVALLPAEAVDLAKVLLTHAGARFSITT